MKKCQRTPELRYLTPNNTSIQVVPEKAYIKAEIEQLMQNSYSIYPFESTSNIVKFRNSHYCPNHIKIYNTLSKKLLFIDPGALFDVCLINGKYLLNYNSFSRKYGIIDYNGNEIIPPKYDSLVVSNPYYPDKEIEVLHNRIPAEINGKMGYLDFAGNTMILFIYDSISFFNKHGYARVKQNGKPGIIDIYNNIVVPFTHSDAQCLSNGSIVYCDYDYNHISCSFTFLGSNTVRLNSIELFRFDVFSNKDYVHIATTKNKQGIIDKNGKIVIPCQYNDVSPIDDKKLIVWVGPIGKYGIIDYNNNCLLPIEYSDIDFVTIKGYIIVKQNYHYGILDNNLKRILPIAYHGFKYSELYNCLEVYYKGKYAFYDLKKETFVIPFTPNKIINDSHKRAKYTNPYFVDSIG